MHSLDAIEVQQARARVLLLLQGLEQQALPELQRLVMQLRDRVLLRGTSRRRRAEPIVPHQPSAKMHWTVTTCLLGNERVLPLYLLSKDLQRDPQLLLLFHPGPPLAQ